jgi:hypothetical protein
MEQLALANLKGTIHPDHRAFSSKEQAIVDLRRLTGKDFGMDVAAWERYVKELYRDWPSRLTETDNP